MNASIRYLMIGGLGSLLVGSAALAEESKAEAAKPVAPDATASKETTDKPVKKGKGKRRRNKKKIEGEKQGFETPRDTYRRYDNEARMKESQKK